MRVKKLKASILLLSTVITFTFSACTPDLGDDKQQTQTPTSLTLSGDANGANERPNPVTTTATGTLTGTYDKNTNVLNYTITWTGLSGPPVAAHFHGPADVNTAAGVVVPITLPTNAGTAGTVTGTATLTDQQESDLLAGLWYYNLHTATNTGGEIRGQVKAQ